MGLRKGTFSFLFSFLFSWCIKTEHLQSTLSVAEVQTVNANEFGGSIKAFTHMGADEGEPSLAEAET